MQKITNNLTLLSNAALSKEFGTSFREGSTVLITVLSKNANNTYTVGHTAGRLIVKSKTPLAIGSKIFAKISIKNNEIILQKIQNSVIENNPTQIQKTLVSNDNKLSPELINLLSSLGLPATVDSKILLQTMTGLGAKFDLKKLNKAIKISQNFKDKEVASEIALILQEKGIEPTIENVESFLKYYAVEEESEKGNREDVGNREFGEGDETVESARGDVGHKSSGSLDNAVAGDCEDRDISVSNDNLLKKIESSLKEYFSSLCVESEKSESKNYGPLTLFNHLYSTENNCYTNLASKNKNSSDVKFHCVILPFDFEFEKSNKHYLGSGVFRVFLDNYEKKLEKCIITFNSVGKIYHFAVNCNKGQIKNIKFCHFPQVDDDKVAQTEKNLASMFDNVSVKYESLENFLDLSFADVYLKMVKGFA